MNVSSRRKQTFNLAEDVEVERRLTATRGRHYLVKTVSYFDWSELVSRKTSLFPGVHTAFHVADVSKAHVL